MEQLRFRVRMFGGLAAVLALLLLAWVTLQITSPGFSLVAALSGGPPDGPEIAIWDQRTYQATPGEGAAYVNIRRSPDRASESLYRLPPGALVTVTGRVTNAVGEQWLRVPMDDGSTAYMAAWLATPVD